MPMHGVSYVYSWLNYVLIMVVETMIAVYIVHKESKTTLHAKKT